MGRGVKIPWLEGQNTIDRWCQNTMGIGFNIPNAVRSKYIG
jgi:hypothetical protein